MDYSPEMSSVKLAEWAEANSVHLEFIQPGKPTQNSFVERFNRSYREEVLDLYVFEKLSEVREKILRWINEYNDERPHESLGDLMPTEYMASKQTAGNSIIARH